MKTLTVQEASKALSAWLRRAVQGEEIAISEGEYVVRLQPLTPEGAENRKLAARKALRELQASSRLTASEAQRYLREVREERQTGRELKS